MKVTPEHLEQIRAAVTPFDTPEVRERYRQRDIPRGDLVQCIDTRYRWDLYWAGVRANGRLPGSRSDSGYKTAHIDTALRKIVTAL